MNGIIHDYPRFWWFLEITSGKSPLISSKVKPYWVRLSVNIEMIRLVSDDVCAYHTFHMVRLSYYQKKLWKASNIPWCYLWPSIVIGQSPCCGEGPSNPLSRESLFLRLQFFPVKPVWLCFATEANAVGLPQYCKKYFADAEFSVRF